MHALHTMIKTVSKNYINYGKKYLYNKCVVTKLGAAAASILSQNMELQGFFQKETETESEKDNERQTEKEKEIDRQREKDKEREIDRDRERERERE